MPPRQCPAEASRQSLPAPVPDWPLSENGAGAFHAAKDLLVSRQVAAQAPQHATPFPASRAPFRDRSSARQGQSPSSQRVHIAPLSADIPPPDWPSSNNCRSMAPFRDNANFTSRRRMGNAHWAARADGRPMPAQTSPGSTMLQRSRSAECPAR
jgi:hypothetical protein